MSADPLAVHGLGADLNVYAYVRGQVLRAIDPLGLQDSGGAPNLEPEQVSGTDSQSGVAEPVEAESIPTNVEGDIQLQVLDYETGEAISGVHVKSGDDELITDDQGQVTVSGKDLLGISYEQAGFQVDAQSMEQYDGVLEVYVTRQSQTVEMARVDPVYTLGSYGHWWTEVNWRNDDAATHAYGWWPVGLGDGWGDRTWNTFAGTEGQLNDGQMQDPYLGDDTAFRFSPFVSSGQNAEGLNNGVHGFSSSYSGEWRWTFGAGQDCQSFQVEMMDTLNMSMTSPTDHASETAGGAASIQLWTQVHF